MTRSAPASAFATWRLPESAGDAIRPSCCRHGVRRGVRAGKEAATALPRNLAAAVSFHAQDRLDERSERDVVLQGRVPPVLSVRSRSHQQSLRHQALGTCRESRHAPLDATGQRHRARFARFDLVGLGRGRLEQHDGLSDRAGKAAGLHLHFGRRPGARVRTASPSRSRSPTATTAAERGRSTRKTRSSKHVAGGNRDPKVLWHAAEQAVDHGALPRRERLCAVRLARPEALAAAGDRADAGLGRVSRLLRIARRWKRRQPEMGVLGRKQSVPARAFRRQDFHAGNRSRCKATGARIATPPRRSPIFRRATAAESRSPGWPAASIRTCRSTSNCRFR